MNATERALLQAECDRLTVEVEKLTASALALTGDRDRLRTALRMLLEKGRPIPRAEGDGAVGVAIHPTREEWDWALASLGGWQHEVEAGNG